MKSLQTEKTSCIKWTKMTRQEGRGVPGGSFYRKRRSLKTDTRPLLYFAVNFSISQISNADKEFILVTPDTGQGRCMDGRV